MSFQSINNVYIYSLHHEDHGKRQIGDMQASEIVVTFLISGIAAIPLQDNGIPLIASIVSIMMLTALEIIISVLMIKVPLSAGFCSAIPSQ